VHASKKSADEVKQLIDEEKPDTVCVGFLKYEAIGVIVA